MSKIQERPPPILKLTMAALLRGDAESLGVSTTFLKDVIGRPLGGDDGDPEAHNTYLEDTDDRASRRRYWRSGSAHHLS
jgi:hypothetical protein